MFHRVATKETARDNSESRGSFDEAMRRSRAIEDAMCKNPRNHRVLTGDRPTGPLHVGHYFGSLRTRVALQDLGVETFVVIADYQVLTDRESVDRVPENVHAIVLDYLAAGLDPKSGRCHIFSQSHVPALNQLLVPFLTLVGMGELERNPTVKDEIFASGLTTVNASMYVYPVHQAADILFCKANVVPVGRDQLPHVELTRKIARRFNHRFCENNPVFPEPGAVLSAAPRLLGLDGSSKMSKSRGNAIMLRATPDETRDLVRTAKTDSVRHISYDPESRPEVSNLLLLASLCSDEPPEVLAERIGDRGSGALKDLLTEALNAKLEPLRRRRLEIEGDGLRVVQSTLRAGAEAANETANGTLHEVRRAMKMDYGL